MISQKVLKEYGFKSIEDYFDMIAESYLNGNFSQCTTQIQRLTTHQKKRAVKYFIFDKYNENIMIKILDLI